MKQALFGAAAAIALAIGFSGAAQAQCAWTGYSWSCPQLPGNYTYYYPYSSTYHYSPGYMYGYAPATYPPITTYPYYPY